jgi:hypothetical protein
MLMRLTGFCVFCVSLIASATPSTAQVYRSTYDSAEAAFVYSAGCLYTDVHVIAFDQLVREPPASPQPFSALLVFGILFDECQGITLRDFSFDLTPIADEDFSTTRDGARLRTTATVADRSGTPFELSIDVAWRCTEPFTHKSYHEYIREPGSITTSAGHGLSCRAQAAGSLSDGVSNVTLSPSAYAVLRQLAGGFVRVSRLH